MDGTSRSAAGWLTVNVWTPELATALPVMVWIQGGGYLFGTSGLPEYDGSRLAREGGVVVVTFNYRVGIEGFAQIDGAPANRGQLDQVAALEWVRDNIGAFGGNPGLVTVFGQSAGGGSVAALLAMPRAAGLFRRAILQSMPGVFFTPELAADIARVLAAQVGVTPTELTSVPPGERPAAGEALLADIGRHADRWGQAAHSRVPVGPVVDGVVPPVDPWHAPTVGGALGACHGLDVPLVWGNLTSGQPAMLFGEALTDAELVSEQMRGAWTRFAADGDPGLPEYDPEGRLTRVFDTEPQVAPYPEEVSRQIWQDHTFAALPLLVHN